ncbi:MAG TPA: endonuclease/exonuclease/phosphatase family protein, partial [Lacipirellulaceae bacterium]|nr:endonuclease/exonuclease/phosphatase family protein [Lacipirellulaceae bacterium]
AFAADDASIRVATYNVSLFRDEAGQLVRELATGDNEQARHVAEVIQRVRPDILLINEFDYDDGGQAAELFRTKYLAVAQNGCQPIEFAHHFTAPVNTGRPTKRDLDKDGQVGGPADAVGFGRHEGQYGMLVLSRFAIDRNHVRTFQNFLWRDMPKALLPNDPKTGAPFYNSEDLDSLRLSSKSFWDVPIEISARKVQIAAGGSRPFTLHLLCSHPTPPVFDGPEDRNGRRNHDEIRLVADYIVAASSNYLIDDAAHRGGLPDSAYFVIGGDLNCDPVDGQGIPGTMNQLLKHPRIDASFIPTSQGGPLTVKQHADQHASHRGDPAHVTSNFTAEGHGCLRIDYVLPSRGLTVTDGGVFWPTAAEPGGEAVTASDHRIVWINISL